MQWEHVGHSSWVIREYEGYEIQLKLTPIPKYKTIFDKKPSASIVETGTKKVIKKFNNEKHILDACAKAVAFANTWLPKPEPPPPPEPDPFEGVKDLSKEDH